MAMRTPIIDSCDVIRTRLENNDTLKKLTKLKVNDKPFSFLSYLVNLTSYLRSSLCITGCFCKLGSILTFTETFIPSKLSSMWKCQLSFIFTTLTCPNGQRIQSDGTIHAINLLTSGLFTVNAIWPYWNVLSKMYTIKLSHKSDNIIFTFSFVLR